MRKVVVFDHVTLDGFFTDERGDMSFAHRKEADADPEWREFTDKNASGDSEMLFGRVTYDMMAGWWPTPAARQAMPVVAKRMNEAPKVVFSRKMEKPEWVNTRLVKRNLVEEVRKMKEQKGPDLVLMGSGTIVAQLTQAGAIDVYHIVVNPVVIGEGRTLFEGVSRKLPLQLTASRAFKNGNVLLTYEPS
jgi:dihydrofolate reductase